ncbi:nitroreductase family protein [Methanoculleus chikugoensis]|uniref:nitroreductase family protein n=1 Tax=Methanoculleus chikugoensis TaxID=118126 RepID=UPI000B1EB8AA|nr:nitroreductase family protein [Methanoculleus chikugoensis]
MVSDPGRKEALKPAAFDQDQITTCSHLLVFCADPDYDGLIRRLDALLKTNGVPEETRSAIVEMAARFAGPMTPEERLAWSEAQTYLALSNALHGGAKSLGFDSCPMTGFDPAAFSRLLAIPAPARAGHPLPGRLCRGQPGGAEDPVAARGDPGLIRGGFLRPGPPAPGVSRVPGRCRGSGSHLQMPASVDPKEIMLPIW